MSWVRWAFLANCALTACSSGSQHSADAQSRVDGSPLVLDASFPDAHLNVDALEIDATSVDAAVTSKVDYIPCARTAQISGAKSEYYLYTLLQVSPDFAVGGDKHGLIAGMEQDQGNCQANPGAYTCSNYVLPNDVVNGYDAVNGQVLAVCGSYHSPSQFNNRVAVWGSLSASTTSYPATVTSITCDQTARLAYSSPNDSYSFTITYSLQTLQSAEHAIIGHQGVSSIDQFDNFAGNLNNGPCGTCSGMPTGTVTTDSLGNKYYNGALLVVCETIYNDTTLSETFTQGSATAKMIHWFEQ